MQYILAIGMPGLPEMLIILVIILMLFGVGKLPKVLSQMGKGVKAFKDGMNTDDEDRPGEIDVTHSADADLKSRVSEAEEVPR
jgi:sec-independent protein translocase protein TatA